MKRKMMAVLLTMAMAASVIGCGNSTDAGATSNDTQAAATEQTKEKVRVGASWTNFTDTFIGNARNTLINMVDAYDEFELTDCDNANDASTQASNLNNMYTQGIDILVFNNVLVGSELEFSKQAEEEGASIIFANCNAPDDSVFEEVPSAYFIASASAQSGTIMGETFVDYWKNHPEADRNGNGTVDYVMLLGYQGHYDTEVRSEYSVKAVTDAGYPVNCVGGVQICEYNRTKAQEAVAALLANFSDDIDVIFACNDDMALGAIEALKASGFFTDESTYLPVCGVDGTAAGCEAIKDGTLMVTSLNNPVALSKGIYKMMELITAKEEISTESLNMPGATCEDGHKVWLDYVKITKDNVEDANYDITDTTKY